MPTVEEPLLQHIGSSVHVNACTVIPVQVVLHAVCGSAPARRWQTTHLSLACHMLWQSIVAKPGQSVQRELTRCTSAAPSSAAYTSDTTPASPCMHLSAAQRWPSQELCRCTSGALTFCIYTTDIPLSLMHETSTFLPLPCHHLLRLQSIKAKPGQSVTTRVFAVYLWGSSFYIIER
jgi:hypothetical protein